MKQTSNAIKFLMAQYRAIFKNAFIKGLATAVVLTAGVSTLSTASATDILSVQEDEQVQTDLVVSGSQTISGSETYKNLTISGSNAHLTVTVPEAEGNETIGFYVTNKISIANGASLSVSGSDSRLVQIMDGESGPFNTELELTAPLPKGRGFLLPTLLSSLHRLL